MASKTVYKKLLDGAELKGLKKGFQKSLRLDLIKQKKKNGNRESKLDEVLKRCYNMGMAITTKVLRITDPKNFIVFDSVFY